MKNNNIDIIHTHLVKPYAIPGLVNIILQKKFIFNYHGIFLRNNPYYNFFERNIYSTIHFLIHLFGKVEVVLVPSKRSKELLMLETSLFPEPIVYYNGFDLSEKSLESSYDLLDRIKEIKNNKMIIAVIGRLEVDKRIDRAIDLMKKIITKEKNVHMFVFGDGSLKFDLQKYVERVELTGCIDFLGYAKEIRNYYKPIDIVLFTSDWEGMPLALWEAMANGVPVVAPNVGGFKEILEENNCGFVYAPGNNVEAEEKILQLLDDDQLRKKTGKNGRSAIESKYNENIFINSIEQVYLNLLLK